MAFLEQVAIFLAAAVVVVPLAKRAGMGSVLGYMLAGLIVGPWALDLVDDEQEILHFAELGVVLGAFEGGDGQLVEGESLPHPGAEVDLELALPDVFGDCGEVAGGIPGPRGRVCAGHCAGQ